MQISEANPSEIIPVTGSTERVLSGPATFTCCSNRSNSTANVDLGEPWARAPCRGLVPLPLQSSCSCPPPRVATFSRGRTARARARALLVSLPSAQCTRGASGIAWQPRSFGHEVTRNPLGIGRHTQSQKPVHDVVVASGFRGFYTSASGSGSPYVPTFTSPGQATITSGQFWGYHSLTPPRWNSH